MIVPMKKVVLLVLDNERESTLTKLRELGLVHVEIKEGSGERLAKLCEQASELELAISMLTEAAAKAVEQKPLSLDAAISLSERLRALTDTKKSSQAELLAYKTELDRIKAWGEINPDELKSLAEKGISLTLYEMSPSEYRRLDDTVTTLVLSKTKQLVRFAGVRMASESDSESDSDTTASTGIPSSAELLKSYQVELPECSSSELSRLADAADARIKAIDAEIKAAACYIDAIKNCVKELEKAIELETYTTGMSSEPLSGSSQGISVAYLSGYIPADELEKLQNVAKENAWGLIAADPTPEDDAPTQLKNNKFVSLIYPLTDFIGTVPGYFEYDISGWFLGFILVFFGIIFGDGGYGLLICAAAGALIIKSVLDKKPIAPAYLLVLMLGGATVLWGLLTCTWFGLSPELLPGWLKSLSLPVISNVNADRIWYPFWTGGEYGLTTAQNVQIFCFALALVQLSVAHLKGMVRNRGSLKMLGDLGSVLQLIGMFYVVLSLVVNSAVFGLGLTISGIPVGALAVALVGVGFVMSFVFANYETSIGKSILDSLKNIVSVLLGVVNVFSDIVSYIRLWAVGLAGAAISATVNELASPFLGDVLLIVFAIILLVFGHGLNMILNVLSVIVHGVRLNTLEFSSHLDMSWSGHKYKPFEE